MLAAQGCDPNVVRRDRSSRFFELHANCSVRRGGCLIHIEDPEVPERFGQPLLVPLAVARLANAISKFSQNNDGERYFRCFAKYGFEGGLSIGKREESVRVQDHSRSSISI